MKRTLKIVLLVAAIMLIPLTALAQEEAGGEPAFNVAATVTFLSVAVAWLLEWARTVWPALGSHLMRAVSLAIGIGLAFGFDLDAAEDLGISGLAPPLGVIATGFAIAGVSGLFGTLKNKLRAEDPMSSVGSESVQ